MTFQDTARRTVDTLFEKFGRAASYQFSDDETQDILVVHRLPDRVIDIGESFVHTGTDLFEIRVSDIANPLTNELLIIESVIYKIFGEPRLDQHGLVWKLEAYKQED